MRVEYDHYSKRCPSYSIPPVHPDDVPSLLEKVEKVSSSQNISKERSQRKFAVI